MIRITYRKNGALTELEVADDRLDDILRAADRHFLPPWTAQDESRFREILAADEKRREQK